MPRKSTKRPIGRTSIELDWDKIDRWLAEGAKGTEIAEILGCHVDTIYDRCLQEKGVPFSHYAQQKKAKGDLILRSAQFRSAVNNLNVPMLIWLGKQRLGQKDKQEIDENQKTTIEVLNYGSKKLKTWEEEKSSDSNTHT